MFKYSLQMSGIHIHQLFKIPIKDNLTPRSQEELAILNLINKPPKNYFLHYVDMPAFDSMGQ